jgi:hypothetical protein
MKKEINSTKIHFLAHFFSARLSSLRLSWRPSPKREQHNLRRLARRSGVGRSLFKFLSLPLAFTVFARLSCGEL